ncbi:hypothetical protein Ccrd_014441 [Cynara cardunculus var. scolymus]|uniref:Uncharacterized protein n=1 Tax=Cynara cardunculus var. scolymus TaxID=59895 RepID=A0A118K494_CYNCS|nr:hypothetical protein Ccrd_014441 [Cynara cardunculus var. scolymus]
MFIHSEYGPLPFRHKNCPTVAYGCMIHQLYFFRLHLDLCSLLDWVAKDLIRSGSDMTPDMQEETGDESKTRRLRLSDLGN